MQSERIRSLLANVRSTP